MQYFQLSVKKEALIKYTCELVYWILHSISATDFTL